MSLRLNFESPTRGPYQIEFPETEDGRLLDQALTVISRDGTSHWLIDREDANANGLEISGMTGDGSNLWFVLRISDAPEIEYWGDRRILWTDIALG